MPESEWIPITDFTRENDKPRWSPDGNLLYFTSDRDGWRWIWTRRLDPATKRPAGEPIGVFHAHSARRSMGMVGIGPLEISLAAGPAGLCHGRSVRQRLDGKARVRNHARNSGAAYSYPIQKHILPGNKNLIRGLNGVKGVRRSSQRRDLYESAKILGHSNIRMTETYAKLARNHITKTGSTAREMWKLIEGTPEEQRKEGFMNVPVLFSPLKL